MRLAHLHLPGITPFSTVAKIQQTLALGHLAHKKAVSQNPLSSSTQTAPDPTIITFTPNPVYTTGRRDLPPSNTSPTDPQPSRELSLPPSLEPIRHLLVAPDRNKEPTAEYHPTLRGGQTTYHGPGQLVAYTILDLRRLGLSPRCHIRCLETSVIDVLASYGVRGFVTEDPGVWVNSNNNNNNNNNSNKNKENEISTEAKKITAVGVHLRRHISSYGIGLNVTNEPMWYFKQIVACGLEGRETTSLEAQGLELHPNILKEVGTRFVDAFVKRLHTDYASSPNQERVDEVYRLGMEDVVALGKERVAGIQ
jgi:lipoyl(octanoyl) transferase